MELGSWYTIRGAMWVQQDGGPRKDVKAIDSVPPRLRLTQWPVLGKLPRQCACGSRCMEDLIAYAP